MGHSPERLASGVRPVFSRVNGDRSHCRRLLARRSARYRARQEGLMQTGQVRLLGWMKSFLMLASVAASLAVATPAYAEWFFDLYLGGAFTEKHDIEARSDGGTATTLDVKFDDSFAGGMRGGYWFPFELGPINLGAGLDLSHFRPNIGRQTRVVCSNVCVNGVFDDLDVSVWTVGIAVLMRVPLLRSPKFPR